MSCKLSIFPKPLKWLSILFFTLTFVYGREAATNYNELLASVQHPEKLILNVSPAAHELQWGKIDTLEESELVISDWIYYMPVTLQEEVINNRTRDADIVIWPTRIAVMCNRNELGNKNLTSEFIKTFLPLNCSIGDTEKEECKIHNPLPEQHQQIVKGLTIFFAPNILYTNVNELRSTVLSFKSVWKGFNVGIILPQNVYAELQGSFDLFDVFVLKYDFNLEFLLSYSTFKSKLRSVMNERIRLIKRRNPNGRFYSKLDLSKGALNFQLTDEDVQKYWYNLFQFSTFWVNSGEQEGIILGSFLQDDAETNWFSNAEMRDIVAVRMNNFWTWDYLGLHEKIKEPCWMGTLVQEISTTFSTIFVSEDQVLKVLNIKCKNNSVATTVEAETVQLHIEKYFDYDFLPMLESVRESKLKLTVLTFTEGLLEKEEKAELFDDDYDYEEEEEDDNGEFENLPLNSSLALNFTNYSAFNLSNFLKEDKKRGVKELLGFLPNTTSIGCSLSITSELIESDIIAKTMSSCERVWNDTSLIVVWKVRIHYKDYSDHSSLIKILSNIQKERLNFIKKFPEKLLMLSVRFGKYAKPLMYNKLYCSEPIQLINEKVEIIVKFARIHNLSLIINEALSQPDELGWWGELLVSKTLASTAHKYPVFIARNYPEYQTIGSTFHTDPCVQKTEKPEEYGKTINANHLGTTIDMGQFSNVTSKELRVLLLFAFHKFSLVEVILKTYSDLELLSNVLSNPKFLTGLKKATEDYTQIRVFLQLDLESPETEISHQHSKMAVNLLLDRQFSIPIKLSGIHFCLHKNNSPSYTRELLIAEKIQQQNMTVGLLLEDCLEETSNQFESLRNSPLYYEADYLLCNNPEPVQATNFDEVMTEEFLDTHLYIQRHYHRLFPKDKKAIMFRINPAPSRLGGDEVKEYLQFVSDVNRFALAYQMRFFISPAFEFDNSKRGWWMITDLNDLANASSFTEKEARKKLTHFLHCNRYIKYIESFQRETWKPEEDPIPKSFFTSLEFILGANVAAFVIGFSLVSLIVWFRWKRSFVLTKEEEEEFRSNRILEPFVDQDAINNANVKPLKEYEIPKRNFMILNMIGKGNFGLVYNCVVTLKDENEIITENVAVKMPLRGCSKDSFKSILSELKVLYYVGSHPNVIRFIGAHTKEIRKGEVYIATGLCEKGDLLTYLRNQRDSQPSQLEGKDQNDVEITDQKRILIMDLNRFSHEICLGMEYIAGRKIVHGDLSARNILLDSNLTCKVGDFGLSRKLYECEKYVKESQEPLPWRWLSVEALKKAEFTTKSDIWSYGVTLWEIYSLGGVPYPGLSWTQNFVDDLQNGLRLNSPPLASDIVYEKMTTCWNNEPNERPTFTELASFLETLRNMEYVSLNI